MRGIAYAVALCCGLLLLWGALRVNFWMWAWAALGLVLAGIGMRRARRNQSGTSCQAIEPNKKGTGNHED